MKMVKYVSRLKIEAEMPKAASRPPLKVGTRRSRRSSIGWEIRSSITRKTAISTTATASEMSTVAEVQPSGWLRISA